MGFQINDMVQYGTTGICKIVGTEQKRVMQQEKLYYILQPVFEQSAAVYVPADNAALLAKMRRLLNAEEIYALLRDTQGEQPWIEDRQERADTYRALLAGGDRAEILRLLRTLHDRELYQIKKGKKLNLVDERLLMAAQKVLYDELAFVLEIEPEAVGALLFPAPETVKK